MTKDSCWMFSRGGGGSPLTQSRLTIRRTAAIGDAISSTIIADRLHELGIEVEFQTHHDFACVIKRHPTITSVTRPLGHCHINLDQTYEKDPNRRTKHFTTMWFEAANAQLRTMGLNLGEPRNCKPKLTVTDTEKQAVRAQLEKYPRPWVFICPRSTWYKPRTVQDGVWQEAAAKMEGTKFWLGIHGPAPKGIVDLRLKSLDSVITSLTVADLLVTVDTGPMHIAAALNTPILALAQSSFPNWHLNDQTDFVQIEPEGGLDCLDCQKNLCPIDENLPPCQKFDPEKVAASTNARLRSITSEDVSAVVPIYQPDVKVLNRCLDKVLPQVAEIVVTAEAKSIVPAGALQHPKIRYVRTHQSGIGFGRNVNFGARHAHGKYLLILNDDVFLNPDAVAEMLKEMKPGVGIVVHFLRYESGAIYPTVCARQAGSKDWQHVDHLRHETSFRESVEVENACGASWLIRREAFFRCAGYDEEFFMYCEDNDLSLRMRLAGWKIVYTPHAKGFHVGHQSAQKLGSLGELCKPSIKLFHQKWDGYLEHNRNRVPLGTFDY